VLDILTTDYTDCTDFADRCGRAWLCAAAAGFRAIRLNPWLEQLSRRWRDGSEGSSDWASKAK
jgi:hypothetical protein